MSPEPFLVVGESKSHSDVTLPDKFLSVLLSDLIGLLKNFSSLVENAKEQEADWCRLNWGASVISKNQIQWYNFIYIIQ